MKNKLGATPYDIAVERGHDELITKMSVFIGQSNILKLSKPKKTQSFY